MSAAPDGIDPTYEEALATLRALVRPRDWDGLIAAVNKAMGGTNFVSFQAVDVFLTRHLAIPDEPEGKL